MSSDYISKSALIKAVHKIRVQDGISEEVGYNRPLTDIANVYECINNQPTLDEKEIIRKAFERVVERLDKQAGEFIDLSHRELSNNSIHAIKYLNKGFGVAKAIEIIKEECGINE